jgi:hypothetical protein
LGAGLRSRGRVYRSHANPWSSAFPEHLGFVNGGQLNRGLFLLSIRKLLVQAGPLTLLARFLPKLAMSDQPLMGVVLFKQIANFWFL